MSPTTASSCAAPSPTRDHLGIGKSRRDAEREHAIGGKTARDRLGQCDQRYEVGVVLENRQLSGDAFFADLLLGIDLKIFENTLAGLVVDDELTRRGAFGRRVFGVTAGVLVETRAVLEKDVEEVLGGDQRLEQEADRLLER